MYAELIAVALALAPTTLVPRQALRNCPDNMRCPYNNGCSITAPNGAAFQVKCSTDFNGPIIEINQAVDFAECVTACSVIPGCKGLNYKDKFCYLLGDIVNLGPTTSVLNVNAASQTRAATGKPSPTPGSSRCNAAIDCPANDGCWYEFNRDVYYTRCHFDFYGRDLVNGSSSAPNMKACINQCMNRKDCVAVSHDTSNKLCYLKGSVPQAVYNSNVNCAYLVRS